MKALSLLAELSAASGNPSIRDLEGRLDPSQKSRVLDYLRLGTPILDVMGATPDPLRPGSFVSGGGSLLTDGFWVWRLDLQNYVEAYDLALPGSSLRLQWRKHPASYGSCRK